MEAVLKIAYQRLRALEANEKNLDADGMFDAAVTLFLELGEIQKTLGGVRDRLKGIVDEILTETGEAKRKTSAGSAYYTSPGVRVSYATKALDALVLHDSDLARKIKPHRMEKLGKRSLTIRR